MPRPTARLESPRARAGGASRGLVGCERGAFAGDDRLRTTVSPNGDGVRDAAIIRFRLARPATVTIEAVRTDTIRVGRAAGETIWSRRWRSSAGPHAPAGGRRARRRRAHTCSEFRRVPAGGRSPTARAASAAGDSPRSCACRASTPASRSAATRPRVGRARARHRRAGVSLQVYAYSTTA